ncbi:hypothetical protein TraAM80_00717, partial [Trypanosoma rangeli]
MLLARVELRRVSFIADKEGVKDAVDSLQRWVDTDEKYGTVECYVSFAAPPGMELRFRRSPPQETHTGVTQELRVCCATNVDLKDIYFEVQQASDEHSDFGIEDVTLPCRLWCLTKRRSKSQATSDSSLHYTSSSGEDDDEKPASSWQLLAEGGVRAAQYGLQTVELEMDATAKLRCGASASVVFFIAPRLQCTVEAAATLRALEDDGPSPRARLEAHESCGPTPLQGLSFTDDTEEEGNEDDTEEVKDDEEEDAEEVKDDEEEDTEEVKDDEKEDTEEVKDDEKEDTEEVKDDEEEDTEEVKDDEEEDAEEVKDDEKEDAEEVKDDEKEDAEEVKDDEEEDTEEVKDDEEED